MQARCYQLHVGDKRERNTQKGCSLQQALYYLELQPGFCDPIYGDLGVACVWLIILLRRALVGGGERSVMTLHPGDRQMLKLYAGNC